MMTMATLMRILQRYLRPAGRGSSMDEATLKREDAGVSLIGHDEENHEAQKEKPSLPRVFPKKKENRLPWQFYKAL